MKQMIFKSIFISFLVIKLSLIADPVFTATDRLVQEPNSEIFKALRSKKIALVSNHTAIDAKGRHTIECLKNWKYFGGLQALFAPEHGFLGLEYAGEEVLDSKRAKIPIYSLHGDQRRPTKEQLKGVEAIVFDMQDIGCRSYTFTSTLFYMMEEAAKASIPVVVFDRPNPLGGRFIDGPMLEEPFRSFVSYLNIPFCHGMTIGELALYFNQEYKINCQLTVIPMKGWKREMSFEETGLLWIPTSPNIPESTTPFFYATTGLLGELKLVNIGIGYTLPFKIVGAPWISGENFANTLNRQGIAGVFFRPFSFRPFYGRYKNEDCQGVLIIITDKAVYRPFVVFSHIVSTLKTLYPDQFKIDLTKDSLFCKAVGTEEILKIMKQKGPVAWKFRSVHAKQRDQFLDKRKAYLLY